MDPMFCFLCGEKIIEGQKINTGHVIPKQLFKALTHERKKNTITFKVHQKCNERYQEDDKLFGEYIRLATGNIARYNLDAENMFLQLLWNKRKRPSNYKLTRKTVTLTTEVETAAARLIKISYEDLLLTPEESTRIHTGIWNSVRGLYYKENNKALRKEVEHQIIPAVMPIIYLRGNKSIVGAIANFDCFQDHFPVQLEQFYEIQGVLESEPKKPKTDHPHIFNYRYKKHIDRNEEIWELQFFEDIFQIIKYKLQH